MDDAEHDDWEAFGADMVCPGCLTGEEVDDITEDMFNMGQRIFDRPPLPPRPQRTFEEEAARFLDPHAKPDDQGFPAQ
ncbi:hypothetical protein GCM10027403_13030 [Arthrobacter tecti]